MSMRLDCDLCGSALEPVEYPGVSLRLKTCRPCGLIYNAARESLLSEEIESFTDEFFEDCGKHPLMFHTEYERLLDLMDRKSLRQVTVADVGCGAGLFLEYLRGKGAEVIGVEANEALRGQLRDKGIRAFSGLEDLEAHLGSEIDIVYCSHTLEHLISPFESLKAMHRILREGGGLSVTVPCLNRLTFPLERLIRRFGVRSGWGIFYSVHLTYFNKTSLKRMVERADFRNIRFKPGVLGENLLRKRVKGEFWVRSLYRFGVLPLLALAALVDFTPNLALLARKETPTPR
jgi:SAM-dependent methyltransferase